jgi:hypothetical protein
VSLSDLPLASGQKHRRVLERKFGLNAGKTLSRITTDLSASGYLPEQARGKDVDNRNQAIIS